MQDQIRNPACEDCPLQHQKCVYGDGDLASEILIVAEAPGKQEMDEGTPLIGWSGKLVNTSMATFGYPRPMWRAENTYQSMAPYTSKLGKQAAAACGPSIWQIIRSMPNLKTVIAFGEASLRELSGFRLWDWQYRRDLNAHKKSIRTQASWIKKRAKAELSQAKKTLKWNDRVNKLYQKRLEATPKRKLKAIEAHEKVLAKKPERAGILLETVPAILPEPSPKQIGFTGITKYRGSPLWLHSYEGKIRLFPIIHPAAAAPKRQPRLRPVILADLRRATSFHKGTLSEPKLRIRGIRTAVELREFLTLIKPGRVSLDIENSRKHGELVAVGIGQGEDIGVVIFASLDWRAEEKSEMFSLLQEALDNPELEWGGHFTSGFDERKLAEYGLYFKSRWDSLTSFHILHADLGSARDEDAVEGEKKVNASSATGYDLGFVGSVLCNFPYHKDMLDRDALELPTEDLIEYCGRDVAMAWFAQTVMDREGKAAFPEGQFQQELEHEMELVRIAQIMTKRGIPIDINEHNQRLNKWLNEQNKIAAEVAEFIGNAEFNIGSNDQLAKELEKRGVKVKRNRETGNPMLDGNEIEKLIKFYPDNPLMAIVKRHRKAIKEVTGYEQIAPAEDGLFHPSWKVHGCVPFHAQALTLNGWKGPNELVEGELILTFDPEKNVKRWSPLLEVVTYDSAPLERISMKGFSAEATPDHRWYGYYRNWQRNLVLIERTTRELDHRDFTLVRNAPMECYGMNTLNQLLPKYTTDWVRVVTRLSLNDLRAFVQGFVLADGFFHAGIRKLPHWQWTQKNGNIADALLIASVLIHDGIVSVHEKPGVSFVDQKGNLSERKDGIVVRLCNKYGNKAKNMQHEKIPDAPVWCPRVSTGAWIMRQGKFITVTGNTIGTRWSSSPNAQNITHEQREVMG